MNQKTKEAIGKHINKIISEFKFNNKRLKNSGECPCYKENKPCHNIKRDELNCFLCYCPEYNNSEEGGCEINSMKGKWCYNNKLPKGKIWDCSDCDHPHKEEIVRKHLKKLFGVN